jgi:hypothetical protein
MLFGHNSNVTVDGTIFHVQTEDRGTANAIIDTTVHCRGRVLHRRKASYQDLLPLNADSEQALKLRLDDQHRTVMEEIRSGVLKLVLPQPPTAPVASPAAPSTHSAAPLAPARPAPTTTSSVKPIIMELMNARTWLSAGRATLQVAIRHKEGGSGIAGVRITARIEGAAERTEFSAETRASGQALIEFSMPHLTGNDPALVIEANFSGAREQLRFQLRSKPKVPAG